MSPAERTGGDVNAREAALADAGSLGMTLFLISLGMLFAASMVGYVVVRLRAPEWPPAGTPALPWGLWVSTAILLLSSVTMHWAMVSVLKGRQEYLRAAMLITTLLGVLFLFTQTINWIYLLVLHVTATSNLFAFMFYLLTGLHALHVVGGVATLIVVTFRAHEGVYTVERHQGIRHCGMYWHFLDCVWLVMFSVIYLIG